MRTQNDQGEIFLEQQVVQLLTQLLAQQRQLSKFRENIPALKSSTREEIIKRLLASTDYIYSFYQRELTLDELAQISCLSKFHFLRLFKIAFQVTPHQFITAIRLNKARELLRAGHLSVHEIAQQIGFQNSSSFSRLFYNQTGVYPSKASVKLKAES